MTDIKALLGRCMAFARENGGQAGAQLAYEIGDVLIHEATLAVAVDLSRTPSDALINALCQRHPAHLIIIEHPLEGHPGSTFLAHRFCGNLAMALGLAHSAVLNLEETVRESRRQAPPDASLDTLGKPISPA